MGIESHITHGTPAENVPTPTQEDINAALELIAENDELKNHPRVQQLIASNFITEDGRQLDPGNFLSRVLGSLDKSNMMSPEEYSKRVNEAFATFAKPH